MKLTIEQLNKLIRNQVKTALQERKKISLKTIFEDISEETEEASGLEEQAPIPPPAAMPPAPASTVPQAPGMAATARATDPFAMPPAVAPAVPVAAPVAPVAAPAVPVAPVPQAAMPPAPATSPSAPVPPAPMFESSRWQKLAGILNEKEEKKWMQKAGEEMEKKGTKGALHRQLGKEEDEKISKRELESIKKRLQKKAEGDKKLSAEDRKLLRRVVFALNAMKAD